jgi:glucose-1-phosphate thymidylyltransferase
MVAIILAGGRGTRLFPMTHAVSKQLLPIYDKPMIYYPLSILMLAGIRKILIISTPEDIPLYQKLFGDGVHLGIELDYAVQDEPRGLADAFIVGRKFIGHHSVCLILGDNVFYGQDFVRQLKEASNLTDGAIIFGYPVKDARPYGVVEFDENKNVISIEEKPENPKSKYAIPGLYFYDNQVIHIAEQIQPSDRGEIEITAINRTYLNQGNLKVIQLGRGMAWLDTGTPEGILKAAEYVETIQARQGFYIACLEEISWRMGFIDDKQLMILGEKLKTTDYGQYILSLLNE